MFLAFNILWDQYRNTENSMDLDDEYQKQLKRSTYGLSFPDQSTGSQVIN